jgi:hypothetical protein
MSTITKNPLTVAKESITNLIFPNQEVLHSEESRRKRHHELELATTLGNIEHYKIRIVFEDKEGFKQVNTTIWATTDSRIILKGGVMIPINRIHEVRIL